MKLAILQIMRTVVIYGVYFDLPIVVEFLLRGEGSNESSARCERVDSITPLRVDFAYMVCRSFLRNQLASLPAGLFSGLSCLVKM